MSAKPTGLAAFTKVKAPSPSAPADETEAAATTAPKKTKTGRKRGQGEVVALTLRLPRGEWQRLHQLAAAEGVSIQAIAVDGISEMFAKHGLPPVTW